MRLRLPAVALLLLLCLAGGARADEKRQGYCQTAVAGTRVTSCVIHVYLNGTTTHAAIYSDNLRTPKANPFTADATTGLWFFYADGGRYDINMGGGSPTISPAYTLSDFLFQDIFSLNAGLTLQYVASQTVGAAQTGFLRAAPLDCLSWRNNANSADNCLTENASDQLAFNGNLVAYTNTNQTFTGNLILSGTNTHSGNSTFSGTSTFSGAVNLSSTLTASSSSVSYSPGQMNEPFIYNLNGCNTLALLYDSGAGFYSTDALVGCNNIPSSSTIINSNAVLGAVSNSSPITNGVAGQFIIKAAANGTHNWSWNTVCGDKFQGVIYTNVLCLNEIDMGISHATTTGNGLLFTGIASVSNQNFSAVTIQKGGGAFPVYWLGLTCGIQGTGSGVCVNHLQANSGNNQYSHQDNYASTDSIGGAHAANLVLDPNGNFNVRPGAFTFAFNVNGSFTSPGAITAVGQLGSTIATGTAPLTVSSTTPVTTLVVAGHPRASSCVSLANNGSCPAFTPITAGAVVFGDVTLSAGTSTVNGLPFTSSSTFRCTGTDATAANAIKIVHTSGSVITITGTGSDIVSIVCVGS